MQSTCLEHQWATRGGGRTKIGRSQGNLFYQPDICNLWPLMLKYTQANIYVWKTHSMLSSTITLFSMTVSSFFSFWCTTLMSKIWVKLLKLSRWRITDIYLNDNSEPTTPFLSDQKKQLDFDSYFCRIIVNNYVYVFVRL
jgi:hypothetical protein